MEHNKTDPPPQPTNQQKNNQKNQTNNTSAFSIKVFPAMEYLKPLNKFSFYEVCHRESTDYFKS